MVETTDTDADADADVDVVDPDVDGSTVNLSNDPSMIFSFVSGKHMNINPSGKRYLQKRLKLASEIILVPVSSVCLVSN